MTPIGDAVARDLSELGHFAEHAIQHVWHHRPYDSASGAADAADPATKGTTAMNLLSDVETWLAEASTHQAVIHDAATTFARYAQSPIIAELEQLAAPLDPAVEAGIVAMIRGAGAVAMKVAELTTTPPAPAAVVPGEPAQAAGPTDMTPQPQASGIAQ